MMTKHYENVGQWLHEMALVIKRDMEPEPEKFISFLAEPSLALEVVDYLKVLKEDEIEEDSSFYSACLLALDISVTELQLASEGGSKAATKGINQLMSYLAKILGEGQHSLGFWVPILTVFYDVHLELSADLQDAYFNLAAGEELSEEIDEKEHLNHIKEMIAEFADLSVFDIVDNLFAQSHAMPADFFVELTFDLYSLEEGQDIALLGLLHPRQEVRDMVVAALDSILPNLNLSSISLARLQAIKNWYPESYHPKFEHWIKLQRKKGIIIAKEPGLVIEKLLASEVDGSGAQGLFIQVKDGKKYQLCGLLLKQELGIKDVWLTPVLNAKELKKYYHHAFDANVTLKSINLDYLILMIQHFLALGIKKGHIPDLHLLEIQELLGVHFVPELIDIPRLIDELSVQISPFTLEVREKSLQRSKHWLNNKTFTESWYEENAQIDRLVNRCSNFIDGVKHCNLQEAISSVLDEKMEHEREKWLFHFLWVSLWLKARDDKRAKMWQDGFFVAYAIFQGMPLDEIPIFYEIAYQSVMNSIETMAQRGTHLNRE